MDQNFTCPDCTAEFAWDPSDATLQCPYCGNICDQNRPEEAPAAIKEHPLHAAWQTAAKGYGAELRSIQCDACTAISEVPASTAATTCPFCSSVQVTSLDDDPDTLKPESLIPFEIEKNDTIRAFRGWLGTLWFRPNTLKDAAQLEKIHGVYVPAWTFDANTQTSWWAMSGTYYYVTERVNGKSKQVRKVRWTPSSGTHSGYYDDVLVLASTGITQGQFEELAPFSLKELRPYESRYLAGFEAERYQVDLVSGWAIAQAKIQSAERAACGNLVPGDTYKALNLNIQWLNEHFKHILLPIYVAAYRYRGKSYQFLVNGETGEMTGTAPYSIAKISAAVVTGASAIGGIVYGLQHLN
jgi:hypothetical protein